MSAVAYIGFGSNMGDREALFRAALESIANLPDTVVKDHSSLYETEPVGLADGGSKFLNAAIELETNLPPGELMTLLRSIEIKLGKSPVHRSDMSRPMDLDMLLYGNETIREDGLEIPHPRMHNRGFVLVPMAEIASEAIHPTLNCTIGVLLARLGDEELKGIKKQPRPME